MGIVVGDCTPDGLRYLVKELLDVQFRDEDPTDFKRGLKTVLLQPKLATGQGMLNEKRKRGCNLFNEFAISAAECVVAAAANAKCTEVAPRGPHRGHAHSLKPGVQRALNISEGRRMTLKVGVPQDFQLSLS